MTIWIILWVLFLAGAMTGFWGWVGRNIRYEYHAAREVRMRRAMFDGEPGASDAYRRDYGMNGRYPSSWWTSV